MSTDSTHSSDSSDLSDSSRANGSAVPDFVRDDLTKLGIEIPEPMLAALADYLDMLLETNQRMNLTGIRDRDAAWRRHIVDSLTLLAFLADVPEDAKLLDVGSGGGLPGVVLTITRPDVNVSMLEATGKKAVFLRKFCKNVIRDRAEAAGQDDAHRGQYDVVTCRAVGPMRELLEYTLPFLRVGGMLLAMKGPSVEEELRDAGDALATLGGGAIEVIDAYPEGFELNTVIVRVMKQEPTPKTYPRLPGVPRQTPL